MALYRDMDRAALDAAYDNSRAVANSAELLAGFQARSDRLRRERPQHLDLRYGPAEVREKRKRSFFQCYYERLDNPQASLLGTGELHW